MKCRHKIAIVDLEAIFQSQIDQIQSARKESEETQQSAISLRTYLPEFTTDEKRDIIESAVNRITVGVSDIDIEFAVTSISDLSLNNGYTLATSGVDQPKAPERPDLTDLSEPLLSEVAAAKFLGISRMTLLWKRNRGEIKYFRVGFRVLYSKKKHLLPFLATCERAHRTDIS